MQAVCRLGKAREGADVDRMMAVHACENENCLARFEAELDPETLGSERKCPACGNSGFAGGFWAYPEGCLRPEDEDLVVRALRPVPRKGIAGRGAEGRP